MTVTWMTVTWMTVTWMTVTWMTVTWMTWAVLPRHRHPVPHPGHARAGARDAVDDDQAVEADPHPAEDAARVAAAGRARGQVAGPVGEQGRRDALAEVGRGRPPVDRQFDERAAPQAGR
jgi:hypothetical protein